MHGPRVSVVLPTHNRPALFEEALLSIVQQSYPDWETVVVDDASTPPLPKDAWLHMGDRLRWVKHDRARGGAGSKAAGTVAARGEFVAYLDDDDLYDRRFLELALGALDRHKDIDVLFVGVDWFGSGATAGVQGHGESLARVLAMSTPSQVEPNLWRFDERLLKALLHTVPMPFQRPVARRAAIARVGLHRDECLLWDCDWALRAALVCRCALLDLPLYRQRADGQGYFSQPDRQLAQFQSALEMTLRLSQQPPPGTSVATRALLRAAASRNAVQLAYFLSRQGKLGASLEAWWLSQRIELSPRYWKLPLGAVVRALERIFRRHLRAE